MGVFLILSFLDYFNNMKIVLCMCPKCNDLMRLSELHLRSKEKAPKTWLDTYESKINAIEDKEEKFYEEEREIKEKAKERGRAKVPGLVKKSLDEKFAKLNYDPYDIKPLLHPIDFVIFDGMNKDEMKNVVMLSKQTSNKNLLLHHKEIARAIGNKAYDWKVVRISEDGTVEYE